MPASTADLTRADHLTDHDLDRVVGGAILGSSNETSMFAMQNVVSQRATLNQMLANMISSMNSATNSVVGNIR